MKCIICGSEKEESVEHIIPEALGNKKLIINRVCESCNSRLGTNVDSYLTNHPLVKLLRINNALVGKKGKKIKFFDGIEIDVNRGTMYRMKNNRPKIMPRIVQSKAGQTMIEASNFEEGLVYFKEKLKQKDCSDDKIESFCEDAYCLELDTQAPVFRKEISIDFSLMALSATKMAYEYAYMILGEEYLNDSVAVFLKSELYKAILSEKHKVSPDNKLAKYVLFSICGNGVDELFKVHRDEIKANAIDSRHTVFLIRQDNFLYCMLNLFMTDTISFAVKISDDAEQYNIRLPISIVFKDGSTKILYSETKLISFPSIYS